MFYQKGIHIGKGHEREMYNFLKDHYRYFTMNSWNKLESIANKVKVYDLKLPYNINDILDALEALDWEPINQAIYTWEREHQGYKVGFNGRSGGYLVLYNENDNRDICREFFDYYDDYEEALEDYGCDSLNYRLRPLVRLVRDFDKLCDELRVITAYLADLYLRYNELHNDNEYEDFVYFYACSEPMSKEFRKRIENS